jgi:hypothetical protein
MVTPGARFQQLQPLSGKAFSNLDGTGSPYTLLTVPAAKTYRLWKASVSLAIATSSAFAGVTATQSATLQDSNGNTWAECECTLAGPSLATANGEVSKYDGAVILPGGTVLTLVINGTPLGTGGMFVRFGGGAAWITA